MSTKEIAFTMLQIENTAQCANIVRVSESCKAVLIENKQKSNFIECCVNLSARNLKFHFFYCSFHTTTCI